MVELDDIGTSRQFDDAFRIGEWRSQINVEKFQRAFHCEKMIQLREVVRRTGGQGTEDERSGFPHGFQGFRGKSDFVPGHRLNDFVGRISHRIHRGQYGPCGKTDAGTAHELDIDTFLLSNLQDLIAESILANRRKQGSGGAQLNKVTGNIKRSAAGMSTGGQAVPEYLAKGVKFSIHREASIESRVRSL